MSAGIVGAVISSWAVSVPSVWYDEAATVSAATRPLPELIALLGHIDAVHGAYYLLMHAVFDIVGYSPLSLRLVSALAVGIATALVVVLDRRLRPGSLGIAAAVIFCTLPRVVWMGGEGRSFALTAAVAALLTLVLLRALSGGSRLAWVLYGAVVLLGCVLFAYFGLVVLAHGVTALLRGRRMLAAWALAAGAAVAALAPFLILVASQKGQLPGTSPLGAETVQRVLGEQWFGSSLVLALPAVALLVVGFARTPSVRAILLPPIVLPTALLLAAALLDPELYQPRYLAMCTPFVALGLAAGTGAISRLPVRLAAVAAIIALAAPLLVAERAPGAKKDTSWHEVAGIIEAARSDAGGARIAVVYGKLFPHGGTTARAISVAYPEAFAGTTDVTLDVPAAEYSKDLWGTWLPLQSSLDRLAGADAVFLITTAPLDAPGSDAATLRGAGWTPLRHWTEGGITVVQYER